MVSPNQCKSMNPIPAGLYFPQNTIRGFLMTGKTFLFEKRLHQLNYFAATPCFAANSAATSMIMSSCPPTT